MVVVSLKTNQGEAGWLLGCGLSSLDVVVVVVVNRSCWTNPLYNWLAHVILTTPNTPTTLTAQLSSPSLSHSLSAPWWSTLGLLYTV